MKNEPVKKTRNDYIYEWVGFIKKCQKADNNKRLGYHLTVNLSNENKLLVIQVWQDLLTNKQIWQELEKKQYLDKKYLFYCHNWMGQNRLKSWEELATNSSDFNKSRQINNKDHE